MDFGTFIIPDWILFVITGVVGLIIYHYLPDETKIWVKKTVRHYGIYILLGILWFYFRNKWGIVADNEFFGERKLATFLLGLGSIIYFGISNWLYEFRYNTHHAIANNRQGSCHRWERRGDWIVLFIGGSGSSDSKFVIPWPWVKEIWVCHYKCFHHIGNQILVTAQLEKVDSMDFEEEVTNFIETDPFGRWVKEEVYFGIAPEQIRIKYPQYVELQSLIKKQNARINELKEMLKGKLSTTKQFISDTFGMTEKIKGNAWNRQSERPREE